MKVYKAPNQSAVENINMFFKENVNIQSFYKAFVKFYKAFIIIIKLLWSSYEAAIMLSYSFYKLLWTFLKSFYKAFIMLFMKLL